jgi:hypothetical protein
MNRSLVLKLGISILGTWGFYGLIIEAEVGYHGNELDK